MNWIVVVNLLSQAAALVSLIILYRASFGVPYEDQTWDGETPNELALKSQQKVLGWIGIITGVFAVLCQITLTLLPVVYSN